MPKFTATQGRYLSFIHTYSNLHGCPPAEWEIAAALSVSPPSVNQMVRTLEKKRLIVRQPRMPRSIRVLVAHDEIPPWHGSDSGMIRSRSRQRPGREAFKRRLRSQKAMAKNSLVAKVQEVRQLVDSLGGGTEFVKLTSILSALELQVRDGHYRRHAVTRLCEALLATAELYDIPEEIAGHLEDATCALVALVEDQR